MGFYKKGKQKIKAFLSKVYRKVKRIEKMFNKNASSEGELKGKVNKCLADTFYYDYDSHDFYFEGTLDTQLQDKNLCGVIKLRKKEIYYNIPIHFLEGNRWRINFNLNNGELLFKRGLWDFYIKDIESNIKYRIRISNKNIFSEKEIFLYKTDKESRFIIFYITLKDGLSFISKMSQFAIVPVEIHHDNFIVTIKGTINGNFNLLNEIKSTAKLAIRKRDSGEWYYQPAQLVINGNDKPSFIFKLDYNEFIPHGEITEVLRWDIYLRSELSGEYHYFRLRVKKRDTLEGTKIEFERNGLYQIYLYPTKYKNLSMVMAKPTIIRAISEYKFNKDTLYLKGYSYLNTIDFSNDFRQLRYLIIRERISEDEVKIPLSSIDYNQELYSLEDFYGSYSIFSIKVPIEKYINLVKDNKSILDIYIQIIYKGDVYERKLGLSKYKYFKDSALAMGVTRFNEAYYRNFLTLTPKGNLKIEVTSYSKTRYKYIKYGQYLDWLINLRKEVWLIGERPDTAQDTGYHFFRYCRENFPGKEIYYVIDSNSKDVTNVKEFDNVIYLGSDEHLKKAAIAKALIGSHDLEYFLPTKPFELLSYKRAKRVFLQHGVLGRKNVEYHKKYYKHPFQIFCVSSEPEKQMVMKKMRYTSNEVKVTGLSRFDNLLDNTIKSKKSILLIPTWREWINTEKRFLESEYFRRYKGLLSNSKLLELLEKNNVEFKLYPHYRMQQFIEHFGRIDNNLVKIIKLGEKSVQQLMLESNLMITDFSSVSFDFNYMSKPIIFYHFDQDRFFANGILRPIEETFLGDICKTEDEIVESIEYYIKNNFTEKKLISDKKNLIFDHIDQKNCQRIYNEITNL